MSKICPICKKATFMQCDYLCMDTPDDTPVCQRNPFMCLVAGTRSYENYEQFFEEMHKLLKLKIEKCPIVIVHGDCTGADTLAKRFAEEMGMYDLEFKADWKNGKIAGYYRNREMHEFISKFPNRGCVIFWDGESKGTAHSIPLAKEFGTQLRVVRIK